MVSIAREVCAAVGEAPAHPPIDAEFPQRPLDSLHGRRPEKAIAMASRNSSLSFAPLAGALAALLSCSSSSNPNPPQLPGCTPTSGASCNAASPGGRTSPVPTDAGAPGQVGAVTDAGSCPGASQIFSAAASSCAACVALHCCMGTTSCPNDPACLSVAVCVAMTCLQNDQSCLVTCEGAAAPGTVTEYIDFQQCVGASCPGCPALAGL